MIRTACGLFVVTSILACLSQSGLTREPDSAPWPDGWTAKSQREEIRPAFRYEPAAGPGGKGLFILSTDAEAGQHGWVQKTFPVTGGKTYEITVQRRTEQVDSPRRSTPVRIVWHDDSGKQVQTMPRAEGELPGRPIPSAEPEHPLDGPTDAHGWTTISAKYPAPPKATRAVVELHLQWAPAARVSWTEATWTESEPVPARKVRLSTIHFPPTARTPEGNREQFAPLIAEAARKKADLVVLGETVTYVGVGKKPHEVAESIPGPSSEYFGSLAKQHRLHLVVSLYERDGRAVYNAAVLLGPEGQLIGKYRKVCLPHAEIESGVTPGNDYPVFKTAIGKIGMMVCYDGFFPEVARDLTKRGAEVIAWPVWGCDPLLAQARANENRVHIVSSTYMAPNSNWMLSAVYDRDGRPLAVAQRSGDVVVHEVDLNEHRVGPYNLGAFHDMVQRHRPVPVPETAPPASASVSSSSGPADQLRKTK